MDKTALRTTCLQRQSDIPRSVLYESGKTVAQHLFTWVQSNHRVASNKSPNVAAFASLPSEIETDIVIQRFTNAEYRIALPTIVDAKLEFRTLGGPVESLPIGPFQVRTPRKNAPVICLEECICIIVPGLAFDAHGGRLGFRKGFYDRALQDLIEQCDALELPLPPTVGIGLDTQLLEQVPMQSHDVFLSHLCTPKKGVFRAQTSSASQFS